MQVTLLDHMGSDLSVVNAARVSFDKESEWEEVIEEVWEDNPLLGGQCFKVKKKRLKNIDARLIQFLARGYTTGEWDELIASLYEGCNDLDSDIIEQILKDCRNKAQHWSPFAHTCVSLRVKAPIFVARQLGKHQVGLVWNEISRRYVDDEPEFYAPKEWRAKANNVKQGSSDTSLSDKMIDPWETDQPNPVTYWAESWMQDAVANYKAMLDAGVCPEQARMILPQSMMTTWIWTGSMLAFSRVCKQRLDPHAQRETQEIARQINDLIEPLFPVSWKALMEN